MVAYVIADIEITDAKRFEEYRKAVPASIAQYGGRYLVRGGAISPLEGDWNPARIVILEFPDAQRAKQWLESPEYAGARQLRQECASTDMVLVEGLQP
jgi:uncharacterized protein (DUF1330 family)